MSNEQFSLLCFTPTASVCVVTVEFTINCPRVDPKELVPPVIQVILSGRNNKFQKAWIFYTHKKKTFAVTFWDFDWMGSPGNNSFLLQVKRFIYKVCIVFYVELFMVKSGPCVFYIKNLKSIKKWNSSTLTRKKYHLRIPPSPPLKIRICSQIKLRTDHPLTVNVHKNTFKTVIFEIFKFSTVSVFL